MLYTAMAWDGARLPAPVLKSLSALACSEDGSSDRQVHWSLQDGSGVDNPVYAVTARQEQRLSAAQAWGSLRTWLGGIPIIVEDLDEMRQQLDATVEEWGYDPLPRAQVLPLAQLARILAPECAERDAASLARHLAVADMHVGHAFFAAVQTVGQTALRAERLATVAAALIGRLKELPLITLQSLQEKLAGHPAWQTLLANELARRLGGMSDADERVKVLHGIAFVPTPAPAQEDAPSGDGRSAPDARTLQKDGLDWLKDALRSRGGGFEERQGQRQMLCAAADALCDDRHLIAEAGTGTGKSLAYLIPGVLFSAQTGERLVVATHTVALQEQLFRGELNALANARPGTVRAAVLKGRNHYICMRKQSAMADMPVRDGERDFHLAVSVWLTKTDTGDREEFAIGAKEREYWQSIQSDTASCINRRCPFFRDCHYFRAKRRASAADVVVTNHSLVLSDLRTDSRILPPYRRLVIDEAHQFEEQATRQFGADISAFDLSRQIERLASARGGAASELRRSALRAAENGRPELGGLANWLEKIIRIAQEAGAATAELFDALDEFERRTQPGNPEWRIRSSVVEEPGYAAVREAGQRVEACERHLSGALADYGMGDLADVLDDLTFGRVEDLAGRIAELQSGLGICAEISLCRRPEEDFVGWVSRRAGEGRDRVSLHLAPLSVAEALRRELFDQKDTVILTSATLSVAGSFGYALSQLGLDGTATAGRLVELRVESPFDYRTQAFFCVPANLPDVRDEPRFTEAVIDALEGIATAANGRTLALFTSYRMLRAVYEGGRAAFSEKGLTTLAQGYDEHRRLRLIERFRSMPRALLLGVSSFWEGVDIQGDDLSCLVIVKLPFAVPGHPVVAARSERLLAQGLQPFYHYSVPQAVIRFTQGFGRLIRSQSDRGAVFVLDRRLIEARYGRQFIRSLPDISVRTLPLPDACAQAARFFAPSGKV